MVLQSQTDGRQSADFLLIAREFFFQIYRCNFKLLVFRRPYLISYTVLVTIGEKGFVQRLGIRNVN